MGRSDRCRCLVAVTLDDPSPIVGTNAGELAMLRKSSPPGSRPRRTGCPRRSPRTILRRRLSYVESVVAGVAVALSTGFLWGLSPGIEQAREGAWLLVYVVALGSLLLRCGPVWCFRFVRKTPWFWMPIGAAFLSVLWSPDPGTTLFRASLLLATTWTGIFMSACISPPWLMRILFVVFTLVLVSDAISIYALPDVTAVEVYGWHGLHGDKNLLGSTAAIASVCFVVVLVRGWLPWPLPAAMLGVAALVIWGANSATSNVVAVAGGAIIVGFYMTRHLKVSASFLYMMVVAGIVVAGIVVAQHLEFFVAVVGRDATLTKRTGIWADAISIIADHPWLGHGYGTVWELGRETWFPGLKTTTWSSHAHNGYLNLATQVGLPVATMAVVQILLSFYRSIRNFQREHSSTSYFAIACIFMFIISNTVESSLYRHNVIFWLIMVAVFAAQHLKHPATTTAQGRREHKPQPTRTKR